MGKFWKYWDPERPEKYRQRLIERYIQWLKRICDYKTKLYKEYTFPEVYKNYITNACRDLPDYNMTYDKVCNLSKMFTRFKKVVDEILYVHKEYERWEESNRQWDFTKCPFIVTKYDGYTWLSYVSYVKNGEDEVEAYGIFIDQGKIYCKGQMTFLYDWCCFREMNDSEFEEMVGNYMETLMRGGMTIFETEKYRSQLEEEWEKYKENRDKE